MIDQIKDAESALNILREQDKRIKELLENNIITPEMIQALGVEITAANKAANTCLHRKEIFENEITNLQKTAKWFGNLSERLSVAQEALGNAYTALTNLTNPEKKN